MWTRNLKKIASSIHNVPIEGLEIQNSADKFEPGIQAFWKIDLGDPPNFRIEKLHLYRDIHSPPPPEYPIAFKI